jgi:hypothetical protein
MCDEPKKSAGAYIMSVPLTNLVAPLVETAKASDFPAILVSIKGLSIALVSTVVIGGFFGLIPAISQVKLPISESLQEA